jgi:hypothetical protein
MAAPWEIHPDTLKQAWALVERDPDFVRVRTKLAA